MSKKYYVYHLINPINNEVFYVGKGSGDRCNNHEKQVLRNPEKYGKSSKGKVINRILKQGLKVVVKKVSLFGNEVDALNEEKNHIEFFGFDNLTNINSCGGISGKTQGLGDTLLGKEVCNEVMSIADVRLSDRLPNKYGWSLKDSHHALTMVFNKCINGVNRSSFLYGVDKVIGEKFVGAFSPLVITDGYFMPSQHAIK